MSSDVMLLQTVAGLVEKGLLPKTALDEVWAHIKNILGIS